MNRGEIWWGELPDYGRRPYLVLTRQAAIPVLKSLLVVPATRTIRGSPTEVKLDTEDGMPAACAFNFDNVLTIPKWGLTEMICRLSLLRLEEVCRSLKIASGC